MDKIKNSLRKSYFIVNKFYLFIIFIILTLEDLTLGIYYFLFSLVIFGWKTLRSQIPIDVPKDINHKTYIYKTYDEDKDLKMDIWYPPTKYNKNYPLVYFCHGGGWISGFRNQPNNVSWCKFLASKGFAVSSIDYRYGYRNDMEDILKDYSDGISFIKEKSKELNIDTNNIILMGLSAGGHLSLLYSAYNTFMDNEERMKGIKSVVAYYAPSNLEDIFIEDNKSIFAKFATLSTMKGPPSDIGQVYKYYSPINWISEKMLPSLIVHGEADMTVPFQSSLKLVERFRMLNIPHVFLVHKTGGHSFDTQLKDYRTLSILDQTVRFIRRTIKKGH